MCKGASIVMHGTAWAIERGRCGKVRQPRVDDGSASSWTCQRLLKGTATILRWSGRGRGRCVLHFEDGRVKEQIVVLRLRCCRRRWPRLDERDAEGRAEDEGRAEEGKQAHRVLPSQCAPNMANAPQRRPYRRAWPAEADAESARKVRRTQRRCRSEPQPKQSNGI